MKSLDLRAPDLDCHEIPRTGVMGDIVNSSGAKSISKLHSIFNEVVAKANSSFKTLSPLTITLGDEFQCICQSLEQGLEVARYVRYELLLQDVDCRLAIGHVSIEAPLNPRHAWNMMGPGFAEIRAKLNEKQSLNRYRFYIPGELRSQSLLEAITLAITHIESGWTKRQGQFAIARMGQKLEVPEIAKRHRLTSRSVYKTVAAAHVDLCGQLWEIIEKALGEIDAFDRTSKEAAQGAERAQS